MSSLSELLEGALLLDFDGPICSVFAGKPAHKVAAYLRNLASHRGYSVDELDRSTGPIEMLHWANQRSDDLTVLLERALCQAEREAVRSATATEHAVEVITAAANAGKTVAVVSNNSPIAIQEYLALHGLTKWVDVVVGRPWAKPAAMKPHPSLIHEAARKLGVSATECVLVGDAVTDIKAAHVAGAAAIGFANKPYKAERLVAAGADRVVHTMSEVASALAVVNQQ